MQVSVIIPCYNVEKYVEEALNSILNQSYKKLEIICIDDASTDNTYNILKLFELVDSRVKIYRNDFNLGVITTLNKLVGLSNSEVLIRMDSDDISDPKRIEFLVEEYTKYKYDLISSDYYIINEIGEILKDRKFPLLKSPNGLIYTTYFNSPIPHPQSLIKKSVLLNTPYNQHYKSVEDYFLWSCLLKENNFKIKILDKKLYYYRINSKGISNLNFDTQSKKHIVIAKDFISSTLDLDVSEFNFWAISKKQINYNNIELKQLMKYLNEIILIHFHFNEKYKLSKESLNEVKNYTSNYMLYVLLTICFELVKIKKFNRMTFFLLLSLKKYFNFFMNRHNFRWILKWI